ncbi:DUF6226 family protein [Arthrobacter silvisoli]|uniref:DUF6226 family protein n=1 Tax=Arthrobacter silvisoli TaxID=2291022 RepID=UPI000E2105A1|nr:DUF6226 family protein [Arthrobacter silvisoli]
MTPRFVRPALPTQVFRDADGAPILYGERWGTDGPSADAYSTVTHPERFAPLHAVADALIDYLTRTFDADVDSAPEHAGDLVRQGITVVRAVRVTPRERDAAPLTFVFTDFPGLAVHAGALHDFIYPDCGCDACDETAEGEAEELEHLIQGVTSGSYSEWVGRHATAGMRLEFDGGYTGGGGNVSAIPKERLENARARLAALPNGWAPWPLRAE